MVTGGMAPNREGGVFPGAAGLFSAEDIANHRIVTDRVHGEGGKIAMQILHAGRYAYSKDCVAPSPVKSPISPFPPRELDEDGIEKQIADIVTAAVRAREAGYDGVEVMGSEGYFLNQFLVTHTNKRTDRWGGSYENRMRLPLEVVRRVRAAVGADFIVIYRLSMIDLVPNGSTWDEVVWLAREVERGGRHDHQHRHRLARGADPDDCHLRAAPGVFLGDAKADGAGGDPGDHLEPDQHAAKWPRRCWPRAAPIWSVMARPFLADSQFVRKAATERAAADRALYRVQSGLPGSHVFGQDQFMPGEPARVPRDGTGL